MYEIKSTYGVIQIRKNIVSCPAILLLAARGQQKPGTGKKRLNLNKRNALSLPRESCSQPRNKSLSSRGLELRFYSVTGESSKINRSALKV